MRRFLIPEVIQTSAMDCGPAALKSLLEGFGVRASYGRLREACFTGVDGTSIDQIEEAAVSLGLQAEQIMLPVDHLLLDEASALPALVVVKLAGGATHFVVAWRRCGNWIQVMDPGVGRQWRSCSDFLSQLYVHSHQAPAADWREWAGSPDFQKPLKARLQKLGINNDLLNQALADESPATLSALDAATRLVESLAVEGAVQRGSALSGLLASLVKQPESIPPAWWSALPESGNPEQIQLRGAVLMRVAGLRPAAEVDHAALAPEFSDALSEDGLSPLAELCKAWRADGIGAPLALAAALILAAAGVAAEAILFRGMFDIGSVLMLGSQRWWALGALAVFLAIVTRIELSITGATLQAGRKFEGLLRLKFLSKIPRLPDAYFRSRLMSDMAERAHSAHLLRELPALVVALARAILGLTFTVAGIAWLYPQSLGPAFAAALVAIGAPLLAQSWMAERDLRARSHAGALNTFFLDALLGLTALRAHGAGRAIMRQQETLLGEWAAAAMRFGSASVAVQGVQSALCLGIVAWLLFSRLTHGADVGGLLLLIYWVLNIPALGQEVATLICQYPRVRNTLLRFTEPLGAREEETAIETPLPVNQSRGVSVEAQGVSVHAAGQSILEEITLCLQPGEHVAIVGTSGAGKSTLAGLLLGWNRPSAGTLRADGETLDAAGVARLRQSTVWISPQTHIWNRSLYENLQYGNDIGAGSGIDAVLQEAELTGVIEKLSDGMQTSLGESGRLLSGGEGQRVRFGRGLRRAHVRLAILDEAFRGLERGRRRTLLETARKRWKDATLLNITHDLGETWCFPRVLVVDKGRIVEDGSPQDLYRRPDSRYRALVDAEEAVQSSVWSDRKWRTLAMQNGRLEEKPAAKPALRPKEIAC